MYKQIIVNEERLGKDRVAEYCLKAKSFLESLDLPPCLGVCYRDDDLSPIGKILSGYENYVIFGTGGSSLTGQVIKSITGNKIVHLFDNLDPETFDISCFDPNTTLLIVVSKSGETLETLAQLASVRGWPSKNILVVTEDKDSTLKRLVGRFSLKFIPHPKDIGGRFSAFSINGAIPCYICGLDPLELRGAGKRVIESRIDDIAIGAAVLALCIKDGLSIMPLITYGDKIRALMDWLVQLICESLGKGGSGIMAVNVRGAVYQHSQLQLFLAGPKDKYFNIFSVNNFNKNVSLGNEYTHGLLKSDLMSKVFFSEYKAAFDVLSGTGSPVRSIILDNVSIESIGAIFAHFMLETIASAHLLEIDVFNQPDVDKIKAILKREVRG